MGERAPSFEADIRPLFREEDVESMAYVFDLSSYEEVRDNAELIYDRVADGTMPCDDAWPDSRITLFRSWIDSGMAP